MSFRMADEPLARIRVIGVGGGGGNAINTMVESKLQGVQFIAANTDIQALENSKADICLQLGPGITKGLGAGADPERGKEAALESIEEIKKALKGADMVFVTAGLGGGTGTGAAPVVAKLSREMGALTVAVVTKPFFFEAKIRMQKAEKGWEELKKHVDTIITIPNDRLLAIMQKGSKLMDMMKKADDVLLQAVKGITDLITLPGHINVDFADLRAVMQQVGPAIMGAGSAVGENRAIEAAKRAIDNPLLQDSGIDGARGVLINISASQESLTMNEFMEASALIQEKAHVDANVIVGALFDDNLGDELRVTVIATGINGIEEVVSPMRPLKTVRSNTQAEAQQAAAASAPPEETQDNTNAERQPRGSFRRGGNAGNTGRRTLPLPHFLDEADLETPTYLRQAAD
ncbi:MAG: cell division protein FtsZ [Deltaproteobacteria bacterium RIFOXYD12_FULL_57_12]|nr:MAG: cell division protein FtsZ [Deltaproteobacteria bacterium RIFOXYD12_FULL_57_12]